MQNYTRYKKTAKHNAPQTHEIDYKDLNTLKMYIMENGRIIPSRVTGVSAKRQRRLAKAIKIARFLSLLPYTDKH
jgi:small subunit ribosomal protein S18